MRNVTALPSLPQQIPTWPLARSVIAYAMPHMRDFGTSIRGLYYAREEART